MNLILDGKSHKGKNRIRELGKFWHIIEKRDKVIFSSVFGGWAFIAPQGKGKEDKASRWINLKSDVDFDVKLI